MKRLNIGSEPTNIEVFVCLHPIQLSQLQLLLERMAKLRSGSKSKSELFVAPELYQFTILSMTNELIDLDTFQKLITGFGFTIKSLKLTVELLQFINTTTKLIKFLDRNFPQLEKLKLQLPHSADDFYGKLNVSQASLLNLLKMSSWNEESWDILLNPCNIQYNIIIDFRKSLITKI